MKNKGFDSIKDLCCAEAEELFVFVIALRLECEAVLVQHIVVKPPMKNHPD